MNIQLHGLLCHDPKAMGSNLDWVEFGGTHSPLQVRLNQK